MKKLLLILILALSIISQESQAQVYNGGFETMNYDGSFRNWGAVFPLFAGSVELDSGAFVTDSVIFDNGWYLVPTTDSHSGNQAIEISNAYNYTTGIAYAGQVSADDDSVFTSWGNLNLVPTNDIPLELNFYYKYETTNGDMGLATIQVFDSLGVNIGETIFALTATNTYSYVTMPLNYTAIPTGARFYHINFTTTIPGNPPHLGTRLIVDDVSMQVITALEENKSKEIFSIFPNPASDRIIVNGNIKENTIPYIYNSSGQIFPAIFEGISSGEGNVIPIEHLSAGVYVLELKSGNTIERQKFVIAK